MACERRFTVLQYLRIFDPDSGGFFPTGPTIAKTSKIIYTFDFYSLSANVESTVPPTFFPPTFIDKLKSDLRNRVFSVFLTL